MLPSLRVSIASRCLALPHPTATHWALRRRAPLVSRCPHVARAHHLLCSRASAAPAPCWLTRHRTPAPPSPLLSCPHAAPLPLGQAQARRHLPRPPVTRSTSLRRQNRRSPPDFSAIERRCRRPPPPPHGETFPIHHHFPFWSRPHLPCPPTLPPTRTPPRRNAAPPRHRITSSVSPTSNHLAQRIRRLAVVLESKSLPPASCHQAAGERVVVPSHAWAARPWPSRPSSRPHVADHVGRAL
jgi:hypothetical protein